MNTKTTLTLDNAPKASGKLEDTTDITADLKALETLEEITGEEAAVEQTAAVKLADFRLSHVARALLDKACYALQTALNFVGNMAYRRALDPKSDFDLEQFVDYREEERSAPYGLEPQGMFDVNDAMYEGQADHEIVFNALEECHILLQLLTEMCGWDPEQPMPYVVRQNKDESFEQIHSLEECLDLMEIRYKESRAKRAAKTLDALRAVQSKLRAQLTSAQSKK